MLSHGVQAVLFGATYTAAITFALLSPFNYLLLLWLTSKVVVVSEFLLSSCTSVGELKRNALLV